MTNKILAGLCLIFLFCGRIAAEKRVVYGNDSRLEPYEVSDPLLRSVAESSCGVFWRNNLLRQSDGSFSFRSNERFTSGTGDACRFGLCAWENFYGQSVGPWCSAFLVAPDLVLSAGHCRESARDLRFLFGFANVDERTPAMTRGIPRANVFECAEVVAYSNSDSGDWALFRLDRPASRVPIPLRRSGSPVVGEALMLTGHPMGIPLKVDLGARVQSVSGTLLRANLDAFAGNSGGMVFNVREGLAEGILIEGNPDFARAENSSCCVSNRCADSGCVGSAGRGFEIATLVSTVLREVSF